MSFCLSSQDSTVSTTPSSSTQPNPPPPPKKRKTLGSLFKDQECNSEPPSVSPQQQVSAELEKYLDTEKLDFEEDPLVWWKLNASKYPKLEEIGSKVFHCLCC